MNGSHSTPRNRQNGHASFRGAKSTSFSRGGVSFGKSTPKIPNSVSKLIEGEKPINLQNRHSLAMRMSNSAMNKRQDSQDISIFGSSDQHRLVDKLCPWKNGKRNLDSCGSYYEIDSTQCCKVCTAKSFEETCSEKVGSLGYCNVLQLPYDFRVWTYQGSGRFMPPFLRYLIFSTTAKRFFYHSITPRVFTNRHVNAFMSAKLHAMPGGGNPLQAKASDECLASALKLEKTEHLNERQKTVKYWTARVMQEYKQFAASMTGPVVFLFGWLLMKFLNKVYSKIIVTHAHVERLKEIENLNANRKVPIIYIPLHKSHVDYLLISMVLWQYGLKWPHIIAGNNLKLPGLGGLLARMGAIFIHRSSSVSVPLKAQSARKSFIRRLLSRRRNRNPSQAEREQPVEDSDARVRRESIAKYNCYVTVLKAYIEEMLKLGWPLEVFIEGGRSRLGKPIADPKFGIISTIMESLDSNVLDDVLIVPVAISYDKVMDITGFHREWQGLPKQSESFWGTIKGVFKQLNVRYGTVRVTFGQPFSTRQMVASLLSREPKMKSESVYLDNSKECANETGDVVLSETNTSLSSQLSIPDFKSVDSSHYLRNQGNMRPTPKAVVAKLAVHSLFLAQKSCSIMSTHLVAFVLLNRHRKGTSVALLVQSIASLMLDIQRGVLYRSVSLGFTGTAEQVLLYFNYLFPNLIRVPPEVGSLKSTNREFWETIAIKPKLCNSDIVSCFELSYLSNHLSCRLAGEAILSTALFSEAGVTYETVLSNNVNVFVSRSNVLEKCADLVMLLDTAEFLIIPPCQDCNDFFEDLFCHFESCNLVHKEKEVDSLLSKNEREMQERIAAEYEFNVDSSDGESDFLYSSEDDFIGEIVVSSKQTTKSTSVSKTLQIQKEDRIYINFEDEDSKAKLQMFATILGPIMECYWLVSMKLNSLLHQDLAYDLFLKQCHAHLKERLNENLVKFEEAACFEYVKNALKLFISICVLRTYIAPNALNYVTLADHYKDFDQLSEFQNLFVQFKL